MNIPKKTEISTSSSIDKQQDKTTSNNNRREKESSRDRDRDRDRRDYHSSQTSSNRHRDREDYNQRYSGSRRRYSPPSSSRDRHYERHRGKIYYHLLLSQIFCIRNILPFKLAYKLNI